MSKLQLLFSMISFFAKRWFFNFDSIGSAIVTGMTLAIIFTAIMILAYFSMI